MILFGIAMKIWLALLLSAILMSLLALTATMLIYKLDHLSNESGNYVSVFMAGFIAPLTALSVGLLILWSRYFKQRHVMR